MKAVVISLLLISVSAFSSEIGFDPGMKKALAASLLPNDFRYQESCPDSPTGRCFGTIQNGGGFYTLPIEVNTLDRMAYSPNYFQWVRQNDEWIARLEIDSREYPAPSTPNFYVGLQRNVPIGDTYAGLDFNDPVVAPKSSLIDNASLEFRAVVCPKSPTDVYFLTLHYYSDGWSIQDNKGYSLAFNYGFSWTLPDYPAILKDALMAQGDFMRSIGVAENESSLYDTTIAIDAHRYGMLPMPSNNSAITVSCITDINTIPFKKITFDIGKFITILKLKGIINNNDHYRYSGGIIAGIEAWGRVKVTLDVRRHTMRSDRSREDQNANISDGQFRLQDNSLWYSNGESVCQYINLEHARITAAQDIARIVPFIPVQMRIDWCPGYDAVDLVKKP